MNPQAGEVRDVKLSELSHFIFKVNVGGKLLNEKKTAE